MVTVAMPSVARMFGSAWSLRGSHGLVMAGELDLILVLPG